MKQKDSTNMEKYFQEQFESWGEMPSTEVWGGLETRLAPLNNELKSGFVLSSWIKRGSILVLLMGLGLSLISVISSDTETKSSVSSTANSKQNLALVSNFENAEKSVTGINNLEEEDYLIATNSDKKKTAINPVNRTSEPSSVVKTTALTFGSTLSTNATVQGEALKEKKVIDHKIASSVLENTDQQFVLADDEFLMASIEENSISDRLSELVSASSKIINKPLPSGLNAGLNSRPNTIKPISPILETGTSKPTTISATFLPEYPSNTLVASKWILGLSTAYRFNYRILKTKGEIDNQNQVDFYNRFEKGTWAPSLNLELGRKIGKNLNLVSGLEWQNWAIISSYPVFIPASTNDEIDLWFFSSSGAEEIKFQLSEEYREDDFVGALVAKNTQRSISLPIALNYCIGKRALKWNVKSGLALNLKLNSKLKFDSNELFYSYQQLSSNAGKKLSLQYLFDTGISYSFNHLTSLNAGFSSRIHLNSVAEAKEWQTKPYSLGTSIGIQYKF